MIKTKHFLFALLGAVLLTSCGSNETTPFDHAAQALIDNDTLVKFFKNNYYNPTTKLVEPLKAGETALADDAKLITKEVTENDIKYKLYYYQVEVGTDPKAKGFPTVMDSVLTKYDGRIISNSKTVANSFEKNTAWLTLANVIPGWTHAFVHFKGGQNTTVTNGPLSYTGEGDGIIFIPSGLAYRNVGSGSVPANGILLFYIKLWDIVPNTDHDRDNVPSIFEDPDGDGNPKNDNTDGDSFPNYLDTDDDGDRVLTKDEDKNKDGDPRNDFNDPNNPTLPDYLNRNAR
ncbi:Peptidyl-prolyl cis-trans isomerase [Tenacibaculum litopenaei]|jgi:FKBP-type peptidyl-prolyl cis-trans isomerase|uniref:FKBP-type peptidyl-prolyl cis-trans isomerase n=1 Tax=Tenacibaculum litopenaei TaxID=396016 RepID=UPI0038966727